MRSIVPLRPGNNTCNDMRNLGVERWLPYGVASAVMGIVWATEASIPAESRKDILTAAISIAAIFTGFLATAKAILMSLPHDGVMGRIRKSGYIGPLATYLAEGIFSGVIYCCVALAGYFPLPDVVARWFPVLWFGLGVFVLASFYRVTNVMLLILRLPLSESAD